MLKNIFLIIAVAGILSGCGKNYDAKKVLSQKQYDTLLIRLAPYVIKKPDEITYDDRFAKGSVSYYKQILRNTNGELRYFLHRDSANFFFFCSRDLSSLYEHYRALGGYYKMSGDTIIFLNLLFHTPRLTREEMNDRGEELFEAMTSRGNVDAYIGNRKYVHTPNADFYYDTKRNRWDYTENSSWKFLKESKEQKESSDE